MRTPAGRYELGLRVIELLNPYQREPELRDLALPYLQRMHELTGETVRLAVVSGDQIVIIDGMEPLAPIVSRSAVGATFPLHLGPMARAALAAMPDEAIEDYIARHKPLRGATPQSLTTREKVWADVEAVRTQGYARGLGDLSPGLISAAFSIVDACDTCWGSIGAGGPSDRFTRERLDELLKDMKKLAGELNAVTKLYCANHPGSPLTSVR